MSSNAALKKQDFEATVQTQDLTGEQIVANNDAHPVQLSNTQIENVRSRIKAARLEHLMARQLETDLAIELSVAPQLENEIMAAMSVTTSQFEAEIEALEPYTQAVEEQKEFRRNRDECKTLVNKFKNQTNALKELIDSSGDLLTFVNRIEAEFINAENAKNELSSALIELENLRITTKEQGNTLAQQKRQIHVLEALQESLSQNFSDAKHTIASLQDETQRSGQRLADANREIARLNTENSALSIESETAKRELNKASDAIHSMREQLSAKEKLLSETSEKVIRISEETELERDAYSDLKSRYEHLNIKSLEYQGQHLSRINELELATASLKEDLNAARNEKNSLGSELDAVNKLLMLHGEMLDSLSSRSDDRSKH